MKKLLSNLFTITMVLMLTWYAISYIEIICKNTRINPQYSNKNIIINTINWMCELQGIEN